MTLAIKRGESLPFSISATKQWICWGYNRRVITQEAAYDIAQRMVAAAELFAANNPNLDQGRQSWSVWWRQVPEADRMFQSAIDDLIAFNPSQLSHADTAHTLTYISGLHRVALDEPFVDMGAVKAEVASALRGLISQLGNATTNRLLDFVVESLVVDDDVPTFFGIHVRKADHDEMQRLYKDILVESPTSNAVAFARLTAPGDPSTAFDGGVGQL